MRSPGWSTRPELLHRPHHRLDVQPAMLRIIIVQPQFPGRDRQLAVRIARFQGRQQEAPAVLVGEISAPLEPAPALSGERPQAAPQALGKEVPDSAPKRPRGPVDAARLEILDVGCLGLPDTFLPDEVQLAPVTAARRRRAVAKGRIERQLDRRPVVAQRDSRVFDGHVVRPQGAGTDERQLLVASKHPAIRPACPISRRALQRGRLGVTFDGGSNPRVDEVFDRRARLVSLHPPLVLWRGPRRKPARAHQRFRRPSIRSSTRLGSASVEVSPSAP